MRKLIALAGMLMVCVMANTLPAMAKGWVRVNDKWAYQDESGYFVKCQWVTDGYYRYLIDPYGFMTTGWIEDCDGWYYINPDRSVVTNTCLTIDGKTYFFNEKGQMLHDTFMNGYFIGSDGAVVWDKIYDSKMIAEFEKKQKAAESKYDTKGEEIIWMSNDRWTGSSDGEFNGGEAGGNIFTNGPSSPNGPSNIPDPNRDYDEDSSQKTQKKSSKYKKSISEDTDSETTEENYSTDPEESHDEFVDEVIRLVNKERKKKKLKELKKNEILCEFADIRAEELVENFSHTRPDGTKCFTILEGSRFEHYGAAENIAMPYATPESVMKAWMNSSGHRKNILNKDYVQIGIGYHYEDGYSYWVQLFTDTWIRS